VLLAPHGGKQTKLFQDLGTGIAFEPELPITTRNKWNSDPIRGANWREKLTEFDNWSKQFKVHVERIPTTIVNVGGENAEVLSKVILIGGPLFLHPQCPPPNTTQHTPPHFAVSTEVDGPTVAPILPHTGQDASVGEGRCNEVGL
jgi:hypothetical protein